MALADFQAVLLIFLVDELRIFLAQVPTAVSPNDFSFDFTSGSLSCCAKPGGKLSDGIPRRIRRHLCAKPKVGLKSGEARNFAVRREWSSGGLGDR